MKLKILGSGSSGNCYLLETESECLIIEAGINFAKVKEALNFNISKIVGAIISHEHSDHAKFIKDFSLFRLPIYCSKGTALGLKYKVETRELIAEKPQKIGSFTIVPFEVEHDAKQPFGFLIHHKDCGVTLFITDTYYVPNTFEGLNNIIIEANYSEELIRKNFDSGKIDFRQFERTKTNHMSLETCKEALLANNLSEVNNIVLIHLSDRNSNAIQFQKEVSNLTAKTVTIAKQGTSINFDKYPF